ncbi:MAG: inositol monophosphatase family protein [Candidatus Omnitrophica bacterium]|nr:inositol monophosphatase family protein [Candidatus Omnitrophota bacterium]
MATVAARAAGRVHKKYFRKKFKVRTKGASYDLLTVADTEAEKACVALIRKHFPDHNILAEENRYPLTGSEYTWVIDPLDGTNNFACGIPIFCSSVALMRKGEVICGAVFDVVHNELFSAGKGKGAFLNGKRIRVNAASTLKEAMLITGFYYDRGKEMIETLERIKKFFMRRILGLRRLGAAALDLCFVACGRAAGFWEFELSPWDYAAGKLIVEEAGGKVTGRYGEKTEVRDKAFIVASNKKLHPIMLEVINEPDVCLR